MKKFYIITLLLLVAVSSIHSLSYKELETRYFELNMEVDYLLNYLIFLPSDSTLKEGIQNKINSLRLEILIIIEEMKKAVERLPFFCFTSTSLRKASVTDQ